MSTNFPNGVSVFGAPLYPTFNPWAQVWFVDGNQGKAGADGRTPQTALKTFTELFALSTPFRTLKSGDVIFCRGNFTENATTPAGVFDVTIIGAGNKPRHADAHTGNNGYSAVTWGKTVDSSSDPLLTVQQQGWRIENILFECPATDAGILFYRDGGSGDAERDGAHGIVRGCRFEGGVNSGRDGISVSGGSGFFLFENNMFRGLTNGITSAVGAGIGTNSWWIIRNNIFEQNGTHINATLDHCFILGNVLGAFSTKGVDISSGTVGLNQVHGNYLDGDYDAKYTAGTTDDWAGNFTEDITSGEVGDNGITVTQAVP